MVYKIVDACRGEGCPVCRVVEESVRRYLENHFYESVNSPRWRDRLRDSLGFCHEDAWRGVDGRLGDALGYSILYRDIINHILRKLDDKSVPAPSSRHWTAVLRRIPEQTRTLAARLYHATTPRKRCPACEHREETTRLALSELVNGLADPELVLALEASDGLCLPHLRASLEGLGDLSACRTLLRVHRTRLEALKAELSEFVRKSDYQDFHEGFGREGNAWLRAVALVVGSRRAN